jgi:YVTN family beta-propeller protein
MPIVLLFVILFSATHFSLVASAEESFAGRHRSPVDVALSPDESWLVSVNQTSDSVSLVDVRSGRVLDELATGSHPSNIVLTPDGRTVLVTASWSGTLHVLQIEAGKLKTVGSIDLGDDPVGIAVTSDARRAFIGLVATGYVAEVDLKNLSVIRRIPVGKWPRYLTLSADDSRLAVGCAGEEKIVVVDPARGEVLYDERLSGGINLGHMQTSKDGIYAYFPWMVYRNNPITVGNIRRGWVLASRIGRVRLDGESYREAISLDVPGLAIADPHGLAISDNQERLIVSASGTHELLVYRLPGLPFIGVGGPGDLIDPRLQSDRRRFDRIETGGRPMGLQISKDNRTVFVANFLRDSIQVVDLEDRAVLREFHLGGPDQKTQARLGMEIFYDGRRSLDQWYSCHSCHQNGGTNSRPMDTFNDGTALTNKTVLSLYNVTRTGPWTWHGWQKDLSDAMRKSLTTTMLGKAPAAGDVASLLAYLESLKDPPNPFRTPDGSLNSAAKRGQKVFASPKAACINCHSGDYYTDGRIHDVGLGSASDKYEGYNTPSLRGLYRKVRFLHNGRARSLERVVNDLHSPEKVEGEAALTEQEASDLIEYLRSL